MGVKNTGNTTTSYNLKEDFCITKMSMKCRVTLLQIDSYHTSLSTSFLIVFMKWTLIKFFLVEQKLHMHREFVKN